MPKPKIKIRYNRTKYRSVRLPFISRKRGEAVKFWNAPEGMSYGAGCEYGKAAAWALMKHYREEAGKGSTMPELQHIALSMAGFNDDEMDDGIKGQFVGFFSALDYLLRQRMWVSGVVPGCVDDVNVDTLTEQEITAWMERAVNSTEKELNAWLRERTNARLIAQGHEPMPDEADEAA